MVPQEMQIQLFDIDAAEGNGARDRVIEAGDQIDHGALAGTGGSYDGDAVAAL